MWGMEIVTVGRFAGQNLDEEALGEVDMNESSMGAALAAAGYQIGVIGSVDQMTNAFSQPICRLVMLLGAVGTEGQNKHLLKYVDRLACAGTPDVENRRAVYINETIRRMKLRNFLDAVTVLPPEFASLHLESVVPSFEEGLAILEFALEIGRDVNGGTMSVR
jgi:hypothetical protein